eukprot:1266478-Rhodomonas_salina.1
MSAPDMAQFAVSAGHGSVRCQRRTWLSSGRWGNLGDAREVGEPDDKEREGREQRDDLRTCKQTAASPQT